MRQLEEDLHSYCDNGYKVILMAGSEKTQPIIANDLRESGFSVKILDENTVPDPGCIMLTCGSLSAGFDYPETRYALISQARALSAKRKKLKNSKAGKELRGLSDVTPGDLVEIGRAHV